jgi:hypothetical protein
MDAPTAADLLSDPTVRAALEEAWADSLPDDPVLRCEEGGWIYMDTASRAISIRRAAAGDQAALDLSSPPEVRGCVVVATFHTHPNPSVEGWDPGPSAGDTASAWLLGVPCPIRADVGVHTTGPAARRGGLSGAPGFPA